MAGFAFLVFWLSFEVCGHYRLTCQGKRANIQGSVKSDSNCLCMWHNMDMCEAQSYLYEVG